MKKILTSMLLIGFSALTAPFVVNAENIAATGEQPKNATIEDISTTETYDVELEWGALSYTYKKGVGDTYVWEATEDEFGGTSNTVRVSNRQSTTKITASIGWTTAITGVTAIMDGKFSNGTTVCNLVTDENQPGQWANGTPDATYVHSDDPNEIFYTDASCTTEVENGTAYAASTFYNKEKHEIDLVGNSADLEIQQGEEPNAIIQEAGWQINLEGGSLANVQSAFAGDKKIGTVTITIAKFVE